MNLKGNRMKNIIEAVTKSGGTCFEVGGCVRDSFLNAKSKDIDIEVFDISAETLMDVLKDFGKVCAVGASFGVIKLTTDDGQDFDFSLPRRDSKVGLLHRDFKVEVDSTMTLREASSRRDFTINSISRNILTGEILDIFGGVDDLKNRTLRATSPAFIEDPLRVLRGFQFAGRFDMDVDFDTANMCLDLIDEFKHLSIERVWTEFHKWATKSTVPSKGLKFLHDTGWLGLFPELRNLLCIPQDPVWHPEGDVWVHTLHVCDEAVRIADRENLSEDDRLILVLSALCHDLGKPNTTEMIDGRWRSRGHCEEGVDLTRSFLESIGCPNSVIKVVEPLVESHLFHASGDFTKRAVRRLALRLGDATIDQLLLLIEADMGGRPPLKGGLSDNALKLKALAEGMNVQKAPPKSIMGGKHLIQLGLFPSVEFGVILEQSFQAQLDGVFDNEIDGLEFLKTLLGNK